MRVLILRPASAAAELAGALTAAGHQAVVAPAIEIEMVARQAPAKLPSIAVFLSTNAVQHGAHLLNGSAPPQVLAVGNATAAALAERGIVATVPDDARSEGLLALDQLSSGDGQAIWIIGGVDPRPLLADELGKRGFAVEQIAVYRRVRRPADELSKALLTADADALVATSAEIVGALDDALAVSDALLRRSVRMLPLLVPSERVAEKARSSGYTCTVTTGGASHDAIIAALRQLESGTSRG